MSRRNSLLVPAHSGSAISSWLSFAAGLTSISDTLPMHRDSMFVGHSVNASGIAGQKVSVF